jgi:polar amino acid transport system substrate-binding protein
LAPLTVRLDEHLAGQPGPTNAVVRVNAGPLPHDHWLNDPAVGGGRLLGEGCHFLDLICHLTAADPVAVTAQARSVDDRPLQASENFTVAVRFADGSLGTLLYGTAGAARAGKEVIEAHRGSRSGRIEDFRVARLWGDGRPRTVRSRGADKGHSEEVRVFGAVVRGEAPPLPAEPSLVSTGLTLAALRSLESGLEERLG